MSNLEIRQLKNADEEVFESYYLKWENEPIVNYHIRRYADFDSFAEYLLAFEREKIESNVYSGSISTRYFAFGENGEIFGSIDCRWEIEKGDLLTTGGHIGYMVAPDCRNQGVASELLKFALGKYKLRGILRVMVSAKEDNLASRHVIEKAGGLLENIVIENGESLCRYWISLDEFKNSLEIRRLELSDAEVFMDYIANWARDTSPFKIDAVKTYADISLENFADYVGKVHQEEVSPENPDWSRATKYFAFTDGKIAGEISCRWQIEKGILLEWGGHIGYGVAPAFRGHRFACEMVRFVLPKYREHKIFQVMISADRKNLASRKTIEANAGILENIVEIDGDEICRYWINLEN